MAGKVRAVTTVHLSRLLLLACVARQRFIVGLSAVVFDVGAIG